MSAENVPNPNSSCLAIASPSTSDRAPDTDVVLVDPTIPALSITCPGELVARPKCTLSRQWLAKWGKRHRKRLFHDVDNGVFTTDDERTPSEILEDDSLNDHDRIKLLPRPSLIIPDIELGSRQDAGMTTEEREAHQRRMIATSLRIQNYDCHGIPMTISEPTRQHHGLEQYSAFLVPPESDRSVQPRRVPKQLLSRYYRGKVLARRFTRNFKAVSFRCYDASKPDNHSSNQIVNTSVSEPSDYILDFDYWCPTSAYEKEERARAEARKELARQAAAEDAQQKSREALGMFSQPPSKKFKSFADGDVRVLSKLSHSEIVNQILERDSQSETDESQSDTENIRSNDLNSQQTFPVSMPSTGRFGSSNANGEPSLNSTNEGLVSGHNTPAPMDSTEVAKKPEEPSELFDDLIHTLQVNPQSVCAPVPREMKSEPMKHENSSCEEHNSDAEPTTSAVEPTDLTGFEREKWLAMTYCKSLTCPKNHKSQPIKKRSTRSVKKPRRKGQSAVRRPENANSENTFSPAWTMMKKMGFRGRLGLNEDGITEPIPLSQRISHSKEGVGISRRLVEKTTRKGPSDDPAHNSATNGGSKPVEEGLACQDQKHLDVQDPNTEGEKDPIQKRLDANGVEVKSDEIKNILLDSEQDFEPFHEYSTVDNGRRAIILDFEVLILNARKRRSEAFLALRSKSEYAQINPEQIWNSSGRDLCDVQIIELMVKNSGVKSSERMCKMMMYALDSAFAKIKPELNVNLVKALAEFSNNRNIRFGFFHRGSLRRVKHEMDSMCLPEFLMDVVCIISDMDEWPYVSTFAELSFVAGVRAVQSLLVLNGSNSPKVLVAGAVAGRVLGSRTLVISNEAESNFLDSFKQEGDLSSFTVHPDELAEFGLKILNELLRLPCIPPVRKLVLAMREEDQQFHSGTVEYGMGVEGNENDSSLIKFHLNGDFEWVLNGAMTSLTRREFRLLRKASFPPLLAPEDVSDLAILGPEV